MASVGLVFRLFCMPADVVLENCVLESAGIVTLDMVLTFAGLMLCLVLL